MTAESIALSAIRTDGGTQARAGLCEETVEEYAAHLKTGASMPRVVVFHDGADHWLADGFHRVAAYLRAGRKVIPADVRQGTRRDAVLHACGANAEHGLRRTNADKRRAVETLLRDEEWRAWSDREIAQRCGVSHPFVGAIRAAAAPTGNDYQSPGNQPRRGADGRTINTANIGKARSQKPTEEPESTAPVAPPAAPTAAVESPPPVIASEPPAPVAPPPPPAPDAPWWSGAAALCADLDADLRRMARAYEARIEAFAAAYDASGVTRTGTVAHAIDNLRKPRLLGVEDVARLWPVESCDCNGALAHRCTRCRGTGFVSRATAGTR